jgi:hypothetical protein
MGPIGATQYSSTYDFSMFDANRKPAQGIRAPALTRHVAFRRSNSEFENEPDWIERIEQCILTVFVALDRVFPKGSGHAKVSNLREPPATRGNVIHLIRNKYSETDPLGSTFRREEIDDGGRYETVALEGFWSGCVCTLRFEIFDEYFTLNTTIELRASNSYLSIHGLPSDAGNQGVYSEAFNVLAGAIADRYNQASIVDDWSTRSDVSSSLEILNKTLWTCFEKDVLRSGFTPSENVRIVRDSNTHTNYRVQDGVSQTWEIIADFTGFVLALNFLADSEKAQKDPLRKSGADTEAEQQAKRPNRILSSQKAFMLGGAEKWVDALFPLLLRTDPEEAELATAPMRYRKSPFEDSEFSWSLFDNSRVLFGCGFGPPVSRKKGQKGFSLPYVLLFAHDDHRSIGRIIRRLDTLGTIRLAALLDFKQAMHRDRIMTMLDIDLNAIDETKTVNQLALAHSGYLARLGRQLTDFAKHATSDKRSHQDPVLVALDSLARQCKIASDIIVELATSSNNYSREGCGPQTRLSKYDESKENFELGADFPKLPTEFKKVSDAIIDVHSIATQRYDDLGTANIVAASHRPDWHEIKSATDAMMRTIDLIQKGRSKDSHASRLLDHVQRALYSMSDELLTGIKYRQERSQYYLERFSDLAEAMKIVGVAGYQPYDEFVKHRMDRSFSLLKAVGNKYESIQQRCDKLLKKKLVLDTLDRTSNIVDIQKNIKEFQEYGEKVLFWVLMPYYSGSMIASLFVWKQCPESELIKKLLEAKCVKLDGSEKFPSFLLGLVISLFVYAWRRRRHRAKPRTNELGNIDDSVQPQTKTNHGSSLIKKLWRRLSIL